MTSTDQTETKADTSKADSFKGLFKALKIRARLNLGFGAMVAIIVTLVGITVFQVSAVDNINVRVVELRVPTANSSKGLVNGVNATLAGLRGYMITGAQKFKDDRTANWAELDIIRSEMDELSKHWTNPANVQKWADFEAILDEFRIAQQQVEDVAKTIDEQPANKMLIEQAAPQAAILVGEITKMIDIESTLPATPERKALLGVMADVRGTTAVGLANIRAFLLTGDETFRNNFGGLWAKNTKRFADLKSNFSLMTPAQQAAFRKFEAAREVFAPLPPQMFDIRGSKKWNMANFLLVTEAAPRAGKLFDILLGEKQADGSRAGGMVQNQEILLEKDAIGAEEKIAFLTVLEWILLAVGVVIAVVVALVTARSIVPPVTGLTEAMTKLAGGDNAADVPALDRKDEIGEMAQSVEVFKRNAIERVRMEAEQKKAQEAEEARLRAEAERAEKVSNMIEEFDSSAKQILTSVTSAAEQLKSSANSLTQTADEASQRSTTVASASEEAMTNVQTVASATEEMTASVLEISRRVTHSSEIASDGVTQAEDANAKVESLVEAAQKIGEVVSLINDIADQTNLLALNATIEAARAGEAGKGFAVVASEVKSLASQTATATEEIGGQIAAIQASTTDAVSSIQGIAKTIAEISEVATTVASAVEEQEAATREIADNIQQAATGTQNVSTNIVEVSRGAQETGVAASQVLAASEQLSTQAVDLQKSISGFLDSVKAA
jgi:methyl-accepting chemotaxis protein